MKTRFAIVVILLASLLTACNQREKAEIARLQSQLDSLAVQSDQKERTINEFFTSLNEIEASLQLIKNKEREIGADVHNLTPDEIESDDRERISHDIIEINDIMAKNKATIAQLSQKLKKSNLRIAEFEKMLANTARELQERDSTIQTLKDNLENLNFSLDSLNLVVASLDSTNLELADKIDYQHQIINQAWYALGTKKELTDNHVIRAAGGFLGIGKSYELNEDFNSEYFTPVSIEETDEIPVYASKKGIKLVTMHPSTSYTLETNDEGAVVKIIITDRKAFWKASKYLVVIIN